MRKINQNLLRITQMVELVDKDNKSYNDIAYAQELKERLNMLKEDMKIFL